MALRASHFIIVPDKSLWKIPFHALSHDGQAYLIEKKRLSYSPSVSLLSRLLQEYEPKRRSAGVFANDTFQNRYLPHVNREAVKVSTVLRTQPILGASVEQFRRSVGELDIVHFSMHAQADPDDPLGSFLAFRPRGPHDGRVTVEDLLQVRLKQRNLAFLASCETNNILNGEGVVSIAWALMASGSTSVVSAQMGS